MTELFEAILKASFQGSIVILAVVLLRFLLKRAPKSLVCLLWLLAGLRLMLPFEIQSPFSLQPRLDNTNLSIQAQQPVQIPGIVIENPEGQPLDVPAEPIQTPNQPEGDWGNVQGESFLYEVEDGKVKPVRYTDIAAQIWILGAAVMLTASAVSYYRLKRRVRESYRIENGCFECPGLDTAFVLGFFPPRIYLPMGLTDQEKKFIFDHESTHIARHDHWFKVLGYVIFSVHWFNPLVWLGYSLLCRDMELACDEHVVRHMTLPQRKAYSAALLSCGGQTARIAACPVAFGESNPKKRILNVLNYKRPSFWIVMLTVIAVIFVTVCLLTSPENQLNEPPEDVSWNLEMQVTDVTPSGATVEFIQSGPFWGYDRAELQFGTYYTLEKWTGENWEPVEIQYQENDIGWTMEAYLIKRNDTTTQRVNWSWLYGELSGGKYRIGKSITLFRNAGDYDDEMFWAEFSIEEPDSIIWSADMTGEDYLAWCRNAVAAFQSRNQFHVSETLVYFRGETEDSRSNVVFWQDGGNWLRQSYVTQRRENRNLLCYDGWLYMQWQQEGEEGEWTLVTEQSPESQGYPWIGLVRWDNQPVAFNSTAWEGEELRVSVTVYAAPPTLGWDDIQEYNILFFFDKNGTMTRAIMSAFWDNIKVVDDLTIEATLGSNIHSKLEEFAAQRPDAPQVNMEDEAWLEKCRTALEDYQVQGTWTIQVENSFSGRGAMNKSSIVQWYGCGNDIYEWQEVPLDGGAMMLRLLQVNGESYHREAYYATEDAASWDKGWEPGTYDSQPLVPPWPVWYDWEAGNIEFAEADGNFVSFTVQGSPFPGEKGIREYRVTFELWDDVLHSMKIEYSETDSQGDTTDVCRCYDLYLFSPGEAEKVIQQRHSEALLHVHGICNDPSCTDSAHDHSGVNCTDEYCTNATHHHDDHDHHH